MTAPRRVRLDSRFWLVTAAAVATMAATAALGRWQLDRAAQKEALQAVIDARIHLPPLEADAFEQMVASGTAEALHRRVVLRGHWVARNTVFLDNRQMQGRQGFIVVTPLQPEHSPAAILVQRGWVPRDFSDRTRLPEVTTPNGLVTVEGRIAPPPSKLYQFKGVDTGPIRQNLDLAAFRLETGLPLLEASVLQTGAPSEGLLREWAAPNLGVDKHYGYAFQWFGLCALVVGLYVWFQMILPFRASLRAQGRD